MNYLIGEYECKLDAKGRMVVPAALKRQLPDVEREGLVVNRGSGKSLTIYPRAVWDKEVEDLRGKINRRNPKHQEYLRLFMAGATELFLDGASRVLFSKALQAHAHVQGEVVLACVIDRIELWDKGAYQSLYGSDADYSGFADLEAELFGGDDHGE